MSCGKGSQVDDRRRTLKKLGQSIKEMKKKKSGSSETITQFIQDLRNVFKYFKDDPEVTVVIEEKETSQRKDERIADLQNSDARLREEINKLEEEKTYMRKDITSYLEGEKLLTTEKNNLQKVLKEMTDSKERCESEYSDLKRELSVHKDVEVQTAQEIKEKEQLLRENKKEKDRLEKEKTDMQEEISSHQQEVKWLSTEKKNLEKTLKEITNEKQRLEIEKTNLNGEITSYQQTQKTLSTEKDLLKRDLTEIKSEKERLEKEKSNLKGEITSYQQKEKWLSTEKDTLGRALMEMQNEKLRLEAKLEETDISLGNAERLLTEQHNINENMKMQFRQYMDSQQMQYNESLQDQRRTIDKLQKSLSEEKKAKDNALNRLSAAAASRLRDQNPGITDLSDPNRPLKLAEKVSELYDNEWTNGMENLENELDIEESQGIKILLQIVKAIFDVCSEMGNEHLESFSHMLVLPAELAKLNQSEKIAIPDLPTEMIKPMKDFRKTHSDKTVELLQKYFKHHAKVLIGVDDNVIETCQEYINKCIELCWMMRIQDPPIHMESSYATNSEFDASKMRSYTKAGKFIHFVVWPTFFLHENGPLLAKGVVQGTKTKVDDITDKVDKQDPAAHNCNTETDKRDHVAQNSGSEANQQDPAVPNSNQGHEDSSSSS